MEASFSPSLQYPEYHYPVYARSENRVYDLVRNTLRYQGLDAGKFGTAGWNPLGEYIRPGAAVFVLCNFVAHRRWNQSAAEASAECTHGSVLRAVIDYVLIAVGPHGSVRFGNAPLQSCNWESVLRETGASELVPFYQDHGMPVEAVDLRTVVSERGLSGIPNRISRAATPPPIVPVVLGADSFLSEHPESSASQYRVSDYDYRKTQAAHTPQSHTYYVSRPVLEADAIVNVPKLKTHEKVAVTCGLKGYVGAVGSKDCLAHHRFGSWSSSGDEYPNGGRIRETFSTFHDWVQTQAPESGSGRVLRAIDGNLHRLLRRTGAIQAGAWHGNDTCWRMALDLARIVHFADRNGNMCPTPQRTNLTLIDGIIGGEGNGPLSPQPVASGTVIFSPDVVAADLLASCWMNLDPERIPLIQRAMRGGVSGNHAIEVNELDILLNGTPLLRSELPTRHSYRPPDGWIDHFSARRDPLI